MIDFPIPLDSVDHAAWYAWHDFLQETQPKGTIVFRHPWRWLAARAKRIGVALEAKPKRVLMCACIRRRDWHSPSLADLVAPVRLGAKEWLPLTDLRWWNPEFFATNYFYADRPHGMPATPADYPGMAAEAPKVAWQFFLDVSKTRYSRRWSMS